MMGIAHERLSARDGLGVGRDLELWSGIDRQESVICGHGHSCAFLVSSIDVAVCPVVLQLGSCPVLVEAAPSATAVDAAAVVGYSRTIDRWHEVEGRVSHRCACSTRACRIFCSAQAVEERDARSRKLAQARGMPSSMGLGVLCTRKRNISCLFPRLWTVDGVRRWGTRCRDSTNHALQHVV